MPIKKSAEKALRQTKKRTARNKAVKESIEFLRRATRKAIEAKDLKEAKTLAQAAIKSIDKAAQNKVLKKNTAARMKSRLTKKVNAASAEKK